MLHGKCSVKITTLCHFYRSNHYLIVVFAYFLLFFIMMDPCKEKQINISK